MRLDKYLTQSGLGIRKKVHEIIASGEIQVNGRNITDATCDILDSDVVYFGFNPVEHQGKIYYMFHKPQGCISARIDSRHQTVMDYFHENDRESLFIVGRLDKDTEGLLILTNDGEFDHKIMNPDSHVEKKYYFEAEGNLSQDEKNKIEQGVMIEKNGPVTRPAKLEVIRNDEGCVSGYITISEGRKHQVKRMLGAVKCKVVYLKRISIGEIELDEKLKPGEYKRIQI